MGLILRKLPLGEEDAGWRRDTDSPERLSLELDSVSGRSCCRSSSGSVSFGSGQRDGEGEDRGRERAGEGVQAGRSPPHRLCFAIGSGSGSGDPMGTEPSCW